MYYLDLGLQLIPFFLNSLQMSFHVIHLLLDSNHLLLQPGLFQLCLLLLPLNAQQLLLQILYFCQQTLLGGLELTDQLVFGAGIPAICFHHHL